jgi:hypothetical protein
MISLINSCFTFYIPEISKQNMPAEIHDLEKQILSLRNSKMGKIFTKTDVMCISFHLKPFRNSTNGVI